MSQMGSPMGSWLSSNRWAVPLIHMLLVVMALIFVFPMLWMLSTSLKPIEQTMALPPTWLPLPAQWRNYADAWHYIPFALYTVNTLIVCSLSVIGMVAASAVVAYSFTRLEWPGRDLVFGLMLATMMVPFPVTMVPLYGVFKSLGWIGSLKPLWAPAFFANAFNIFMVRQFFLRIPKNLGEAMSMEGASELRILWKVYVPLSMPALAVVALFQFSYAWNDFLGPLLFLSDQDTFTLSLGLQQFQSQHGGTQWHLLMAASVLTVLPMLALFFFTQKTFLQGISFLQHVDSH